MSRRGIIICIGLLFTASLTFWFFRPSPSYDITRVEPRLRALHPPYQSVKTSYYMDGGSIGIKIVDSKGKVEKFAIPVLDDTNRYSRVYVGSLLMDEPGAVEVLDSEQTKRMLIEVIVSMPGSTVYDDANLMHLRRRPSDFALCLIHKLRGKYNLPSLPDSQRPVTNAP